MHSDLVSEQRLSSATILWAIQTTGTIYTSINKFNFSFNHLNPSAMLTIRAEDHG